LPHRLCFHRAVSFRVGGNRFDGTIPSAFGSMNGLHTLHLDRNGFSGGIPQGLNNNVNLKSLDLAQNNLSGAVPSFSNAESLVTLSLGDNGFSGEINLGELETLEEVNLHRSSAVLSWRSQLEGSTSWRQQFRWTEISEILV
jgi:Leucine-rich repeat (LRR) protein